MDQGGRLRRALLAALLAVVPVAAPAAVRVARAPAAAAADAPLADPTPAPAPAHPPTTPAVAQALAGDLLARLNDTRRAAGLGPLRDEPALERIAAARAAEVARSGDFDGDPGMINELTRELRGAGYPPYSWRQRLVQGPRDAAGLLRQWKDSDPQGYAAVALGDFEGFGAAVAPGSEPPLWSLFVALPRITWERRLAAPLDSAEDVREQVLVRLNAERERRGLAPLAEDPRLRAAAEAHARDMAERHFYEHTSPEGHDLGWRLRHADYGYRWAAENIAKGLFTPAEVVDRWMLSSGHRRNILAPEAQRVGIAFARAEEDGHVVALWVLDFAAPG